MLFSIFLFPEPNVTGDIIAVSPIVPSTSLFSEVIEDFFFLTFFPFLSFSSTTSSFVFASFIVSVVVAVALTTAGVNNVTSFAYSSWYETVTSEDLFVKFNTALLPLIETFAPFAKTLVNLYCGFTESSTFFIFPCSVEIDIV